MPEGHSLLSHGANLSTLKLNVDMDMPDVHLHVHNVLASGEDS
jgi:hypothetical protein